MDDIFDLDSVNLEALSEGEEEVVIEAVPTEEEYWKFPTDALASFLQLASQFSWRSGRDLTSKSVSLSTSEDRTTLVCRATDFDSYLSVKIPLQSSKPISTTLIFPTSTLIKLVPLSPKSMVMKKDAVLIMGQWVGVETTILDPHSFIQEDPVEMSGNITLPNLSSVIPIANSASVPRDRNIRFYKDSIQSTCLWTELRIPFNSPVSFTLSSRETNLLTKLGKELKVGVTQSDLQRLVFESPTTTLWLLYREPDTQESSIDTPDWKLQIEHPALSKIVAMSETLPSSSGLLQFQYTNQFIVTYTSRLSNTPFTLSSVSTGTPTQLQPSTVQTKILKLYLKPLNSDTLYISWDSTALYLSNSDSSVKVSMKWEA